MIKQSRLFTKASLFLAAILLFGGCASTPDAEVNDPWESYNRWMYGINDGFDSAIAKPIAKGYNFVVFEPINTWVSNVFRNLDDVLVIFNDLLQFKFKQAVFATPRRVNS